MVLQTRRCAGLLFLKCGNSAARAYLAVHSSASYYQHILDSPMRAAKKRQLSPCRDSIVGYGCTLRISVQVRKDTREVDGRTYYMYEVRARFRSTSSPACTDWQVVSAAAMVQLQHAFILFLNEMVSIRGYAVLNRHAHDILTGR